MERTRLEGEIPAVDVPEKLVRRRFSAEYKLRILSEADSCTESGRLGELLWREGLYSSHLSTWRKQRDEGVLAGLAPKRRGNQFGLVSKRNKEIIVILEVVADPGGAEPRGNGTTSGGKQNAHQQYRQSPAIAGMQSGRQPLAPLRPLVWALPTTFWFCRPWLSLYVGVVKNVDDGRAFFVEDQFTDESMTTTAVFSESTDYRYEHA